MICCVRSVELAMRFSDHFNVTVTHRRVQALNNDLNAIVSIIEKCKKCSSMLTCIKRSEFESREPRQFALCCKVGSGTYCKDGIL